MFGRACHRWGAVLGRPGGVAASPSSCRLTHTLALDILMQPHYVAKSRTAAFVHAVAAKAARDAAGGVSRVQALTLVSVSEGEVSAIFPEMQDDPSPLQHDLGDGDAIEGPFSVFRVRGPLDFGMVGVMAELSQALQLADVSILAVSTFDTDFVLVGQEDEHTATMALKRWGGPKYRFDVATAPDASERQPR